MSVEAEDSHCFTSALRPIHFSTFILFFLVPAIKLVVEPNITTNKFQRPVGRSAEQLERP